MNLIIGWKIILLSGLVVATCVTGLITVTNRTFGARTWALSSTHHLSGAVLASVALPRDECTYYWNRKQCGGRVRGWLLAGGWQVPLDGLAAASKDVHRTWTWQHVSHNTVLVKKVSPWGFLAFFPKPLGIFSPNFTHLLHVPIYARLQIFIQLSATLTKLCHIKRDHPVHIMSTIGRNARIQTFAKVIDSFVDRCLWQVITDLLQCTLALGWSLALTEVCEMLEESHTTHGSRVGWVTSGEFGGHWSCAQFVVVAYFTHS